MSHIRNLLIVLKERIGHLLPLIYLLMLVNVHIDCRKTVLDLTGHEIESSFHILQEEAVFSKLLPLPQMMIEVPVINWKLLCNNQFK